MAKRKKVNKRVVVLLVLIGMVAMAWVGGTLVKVIFPKDPDAYAARAREAIEAEQYGEAGRLWIKAIQADPRPEFHYEFAELQLTMIEELPNLPETEVREKFGRARSQLEVALRRDPDFEKARRRLAELMWPGRNGIFWKGYIEQADKLLEIVPDDHEVYMRRGYARSKEAEAAPALYKQAAIDDFMKAIELKPDESSYWLELVQFYQRIDDIDRIEPVLLDAIDENPNNTALRVAYSRFLRRNDRNEEAKVQIEQAIAADPNDTAGYLAKAGFHMAKREFDLALEALQAARQIDTGKIEIYQVMSTVHRLLREPEKAIESIRDGLVSLGELLATALAEGASIERRTKLEHDEAMLHYLLAGMLLDKAEANPSQREEPVAEAADSLAILEQREPESPRAAKIAGRLALHTGNRRRGTEFLEKADAGFRGQDLETSLILANLYFETMPGKAERLVDRFLDRPEFEKNPSLLLAKARLEMKFREYDRATMRLNQVIEFAKGAPQLKARAQKILAELDVLRGRTEGLPEDIDLSDTMISRRMISHAVNLWTNDEKDAAISLMSELHERQPDNVQFISQLYKMYLMRGENEKGVELLDRAIALRPDSKGLRRFKILVEQTDPQKRLEQWLEMSEEIEDPMQMALEKAGIYAAAGMQSEHLVQLRKAEEIDPDNQGVVGSLFRYALVGEDWEMAEEMVARAAKINADGVEGAFYKANLALARKQFDEAIQLLVQLVEQFPASKQAKLRLALAYMEANEPQKAEDVYSELARDDPSLAQAVIGMVKATAALGKTEHTAQWVGRAHKLAPENPYVRRMYLAHIETTAEPEEIIPRRLEILETNPSDLSNMYMLGQLYIRANQHAKGEEIFVRLWNHPKADKLATARILLRYYGSQGRFAEGNEILTKLLSITEDKVAVWVLYGQFAVLYDAGQAKGAFQKAIVEDSQDQRGYQAMSAFYAGQKQWTEAAEIARKYLELNPDDKDMQNNLTRFLVEAEQYDEANRLMEAALAENPNDIDTLVLKGVLAGRQGQYEQAEQWLSRAIEQDPNSYQALFARSAFRREAGHFPAARKDMEAARQISDTLNISMELATLMTQMGDIDDAQIIYADILRKYPDAKKAIVRVLDLYLAEQRWTLMGPLLQKARQRDPREIVYRIYEARMELARGNRDRAITVLAGAVSQDMQNKTAVMLYLEALIDAGQTQKAITVARNYTQNPGFGPQAMAIQARALAGRNQPAEAEQLFAEAVSKANSQALGYLAVQLQKTYGYSGAIGKLETWSKSIRSGDWQIRKIIGDLYAANKEYSEAVESYRQALQLAANDQLKAVINRDLGVTYQMMGRPGEAEKAYLAALEVFPDNLTILNNLAYLYTEDMDQPRKALPYAKRVVQAQPGNGNVLDTYGWSLAKAGKLREAEQQLNRAVAIVPNLAVARYHLGWVFEQKGRLNEAEGEYRRGYGLLGDESDDSLRETLREALEQVRRKLAGEE